MLTDGCYFLGAAGVLCLFVCILGDFDESVDKTDFDLLQLLLKVVMCESVELPY